MKAFSRCMLVSGMLFMSVVGGLVAQTFQRSVTVSPVNASSSVSWSVDNEAIATAKDGSGVSGTLEVNISETPLANNIQSWAFDCDQQGWGTRDHPRSMTASHRLASPTVNSGHIEMITPAGLTQGWMFGPAGGFDTETTKYLHFSLTIDNADELPENGLDALFVFADAADQNLASIPFKMFKGQKTYTINMASHAEWTGTKYINRIHFPVKSGEGYNIEEAVYRLDWITVSDIPDSIAPVQDTTQACAPVAPVLGTAESVVFCNRASVKSSYTGSRVDATCKFWPAGSADTIIQSRVIYEEGNLYFSTYDLELNTTYNFFIEVSNTVGSDKSETGQFTTENELAEDQPANYWMTPSPFDLTENANDHLLDNDSWPEAGNLARVYKIHGATYRGGTYPEFYRYDFPKLIYTINKYRLRLAIEKVVSGDMTGEEYASEIIGYIDELAAYGGKAEFHTWDGMMFRNFYNSHTSTKFREPEEGLEAVAEATRLVKEKYPYFEIIPLPNLPNWKIKDADGNIVPNNAGDWATITGVPSWDYLCDIYLDKIAAKGVNINYIEIDHPYYHYTNGRETSAQRVKAIKDYCTKNNLDLIVIVNTTNLGGDIDASFKQGCLDYVDALREDGIDPDFIDVESWYEFPQYLVPETRENSFTNIVRDVGRKFLFTGHIEITSEGGINEITGYGETLQLYARDVESGADVEVDWTINDESIANVDANGLLTTVKWGTVIVTATAKDGSGQFAEFTLRVIDPDEPAALTIRSEGDVSEINGIGSTLQFYAEDAANGNPAAVSWSVDNVRAASINESGLLTTRMAGTTNVKATLNSNPGVSSTFPLTITNNSTGLREESGADGVLIFPNPASERITIEIPEDMPATSLRIVDVTGKPVAVVPKIQPGLNSISINKYSKGIYFLYLTIDGENAVHKLIKD